MHEWASSFDSEKISPSSETLQFLETFNAKNYEINPLHISRSYLNNKSCANSSENSNSNNGLNNDEIYSSVQINGSNSNVGFSIHKDKRFGNG